MRANLRYDNVSLYSATDQVTALAIARRLSSLESIDDTSVITDATACIGGNVAAFCTRFHHVQAVEIDDARHRMLEHNLVVLGHYNVTSWCADYLQICTQIKQDIVFIDPPWGGRNYMQQEHVTLRLGDLHISDVCRRLHGHTRYIVLKTPVNFNDALLRKQYRDDQITTWGASSKIRIMVIDVRRNSATAQVAGGL